MANEKPSPTPEPKSPPEKSDVERGLEGIERSGRSGTVNENAERQLRDIDKSSDTSDRPQ